MVKKASLILFLFASVIMGLHANPFILPLWPEGQVPNYQYSGEIEAVDTTNIVRITLVQSPDIAVYLPSKRNATGQAVVVCPGGGYQVLAYDWEGTDIAKWFNSKGIAAIVLKYRLPVSESNRTQHLSPLLDAKRAMRLTRFYAHEWNIDPNQIGIMGFSAGGHLASTLSVRFDYGDPDSPDPVEQQSCRPSFSMLIYPVISTNPEISHKGSFRNLIGVDTSDPLYNFYSNELHIKEDTPPAILIHSADDQAVPVENSIVYFKALIDKEIPAELHIYPYGGHGYSLAINRGHLSGWTDRCIEWMNQLITP